MSSGQHDLATSLHGTLIPSDRNPGVQYRLERSIGEGGMGLAFLALRQAPDGAAPVVVKIVRPSLVASAGTTATMLVQKEAVALGRLNERIPPTPFVVRFIDAGAAALPVGKHPIPWIAVEYVHGGVEGTTLEDRVAFACERTGSAFGPARAAHAVRCIASGIAAIHAVGVVHRDLTPGNILCCGFGETELFKISDFGVARPEGMTQTFGQVTLGSPGYTAPEQVLREKIAVGPHTDIFSFACLIYFLLTGERYIFGTSPVESALLVRDPARRSILESRWLSPELRARPEACSAIDHALARATALDPLQRPAMAQEAAASLVPWLTPRDEPSRPSRALVDSLLNIASPTDLSTWTWNVLHPPGDERIIRSAAWDVDGHCLAATTSGPAFWSGQGWVDKLPESVALPPGIEFARRIDAGSWLIGGAGGVLALYTTDGVKETVRCPDPQTTFSHASGRFGDLVTAVGQTPGSPPTLWAIAAHRWMRPFELRGVSYVSSLLRIDDSKWVICGRLEQGGGFCAVYSPMMWDVSYLPVPATRAFVAGCSQTERGIAMAVGSGGTVVRIEGGEVTSSVVDRGPDLTSCAIDVLDREWVASAGLLWVRDPERDPRWSLVWGDQRWQPPFISVMADAGMVVAMTVDGGVLEGRAGWRSLTSKRRPT